MTKLLALNLLLLMAYACGDKDKSAEELFMLQIANAKQAYHTTDVLKLSVVPRTGKSIEKVTYTLQGNAASNSNEIQLDDSRMGTRTITAQVTADGKTYVLSTDIRVLAKNAPILYEYKILESYPHDIEAYTQGLEFVGDDLYESTGQKTKSSLRKVVLETGEVLKKIDLEDQYFGEGLTVLNNAIYQLTWRENTGFIYDLETMEKKGSFAYGDSKEGWGLCNNGKMIFKSDGTQRIWTLNPETLAEEGFIEIYTNSRVINNVNELEWVDGKIYANIYQKDAIAIVNPSNGAVEGIINLKGLQDQVTQHTTLDVLNGIAYKGEPNILYVTGKNWDRLFKIEISSN